jgi:hypothetical protein
VSANAFTPIYRDRDLGDENESQTVRDVPCLTDEQRLSIQRAAWRQMFAAMNYLPSTDTFVVTGSRLANAGILPSPSRKDTSAC